MLANTYRCAYDSGMVKRTSLNLDLDLVADARSVLNTRGTTDTIHRALEDVVRRDRLQALAERTVGAKSSLKKQKALPKNRPRITRPERASGGSRTHNPRITNAVLCRLKLRWQYPLNLTLSKHVR